MEQRVSLITLGVRDMAASADFYERLGWQRVEAQDGVVAFDLIGQTLGLYPLAALAEELGVTEDRLGCGAITLAHNLRSKEEVCALLSRVEAAGGTILKPAQDVFWGGYHGYFADPDGHIWEVAHNPFSPLAEDGAFRWNGYPE
ncbi:VOC family protein [Primorskyibacter aestuariivivens]|uniref:VOC family protein n=1 Tax=Primorskyibacter aestuariivivens TaxID=1888912 RepID=UPI0022FFEE5F|nr:VOC family protein [Primorskyibacter aestuariivivens]MDA7427179.1 VOC family protein [Primorskyibacter aestuariivivens]